MSFNSLKVSSFLKRAAVVSVAFAFVSLTAGATDYPLSDGGDIAATLASASDGDTITLGAGTYNVNGLTVNKSVTIQAATGVEAKLDLQSKSGGIVLSADGAIVKGCKLVNCRSNAVKLTHAGAKLLDCQLTGYVESSTPCLNLSAGEVRGCSFVNFTGHYAYYNYILGITGGTLADTVLDNARSQFGWMVNVNGASAVVTNLVIRNSPGKGAGAEDNVDNGVLWLQNGLVTHSVVTNSGSSGAAKCGTVLVGGGTLRNSLVADCKGPKYPGVRMTGGRVENCTIANNTGAAGSVGAYSLSMSGGTAVNNVFFDEANNAKSVVVSGGTFVTNLVPVDVGVGVGNKVGRPGFLAPEKGDYAQSFTSPGVDSADRLDWMVDGAVDVLGKARVKGAGPDMGAYEGPYGATDPLAVKATIENNVFRSDSTENTVTFTASAAGVGAATATYAWYVDGAETPAGTGITFSYSGFGAGLHTVKLVATPTDTSLDPAELTMTDCVLVYPKTVYVDSANANPEVPYGTWGQAATTMKAALDFLMTSNGYLTGYGTDEDDVVTVEVRNGTYPLSNLIISIPVRLAAAEGAEPVINLGGTIPGIQLSNRYNVLDGFKIIKANEYAVKLYNGSVMRNCRMIDAVNTPGGNSDTVVVLSQGVVSNCLFSGATSSYAVGSGMLKMSGASLVCDSVFEKFKHYDYAIYVAGEKSVMSNCVIRDCTMDLNAGLNVCYNLVSLTSGLVTHCIVTNCGNTATTGSKAGGVVHVNGSKATLRNCLLVNNKAITKAGICLGSGKVENCTVIGGVVDALASLDKCQLYQTGGDVVNSIFWHGTGSDGVTRSGGTFTYSSSASLKAGEGNREGDPKLDDAFVPTVNSFARDNGTLLDWTTTDAVDLRGSNRVVNAKVDMGAFEGDELPKELTITIESEFARLDGDKVVYTVTPKAMIGYDVVQNPEFAWTVDGEAAGTSTGAKEFALAPKTEAYSIGCTVTAAGQTKTEYHSLVVHSGVFYVDASVSVEDSKYPYSTWGTAAKSLKAVLEIAHPLADTRAYKVHVAAGNYSTEAATLSTAIEILGEDGAVFASGGTMTIIHDSAVVSNMVFKGRSFILNKGTMRNVSLINLSGLGGGNTLLTIVGGVCDGLMVSNCLTGVWNHQYGPKVSGGRLTNFLIDNIGGYETCFEVSGSGVVSNGVFNNVGKVEFTGYGQQGNIHQRALVVSGGTASHVVITNCGSHYSSSLGLVNVVGGTLRNSLIAHNRSTDCAGLYLNGGHAESCTVVVDEGASLHMTGHLRDGSTLVMTGGCATNCVFYTPETAEAGKYYCRVDGGKIGNCWLSVKGKDPTPSGTCILTGDNPCFKTVGGWNYVPAGGSPLIGKGLNQSWMNGATDLLGKPRVFGKAPDIGACESQAGGFVLIVR